MRREELLIAICFNEQSGLFRKRRSFYFTPEMIHEYLEDATLLEDPGILIEAYRRLRRDACSTQEIQQRLQSVYGASRLSDILGELMA